MTNIRNILVCFVLVVVVNNLAESAAIDRSELRRLLDEIPEDSEKLLFLKNQVYLGFKLQSHIESQPKEVSREISIGIYEYFKENNQITDEQRKKSLQDIICFPTGDCIDTDDPGVYP